MAHVQGLHLAVVTSAPEYTAVSQSPAPSPINLPCIPARAGLPTDQITILCSLHPTPLPMVYPTWWLKSHNMGLGRRAMTQLSGAVGLWQEAPLSAQSQCQASGPRPLTLSPPASGSLQPSALHLRGLVVTRAPAGSALCWPFPNQWGLQFGRAGGSVPHQKSPCMLQVQQIPVPPGDPSALCLLLT